MLIRKITDIETKRPFKSLKLCLTTIGKCFFYFKIKEKLENF